LMCTTPGILLGVICLAAAVVWFLMQKTIYAVLICTAAGEHQASLSYHSDEVDEIVEALNQAFVDRG
jgi:hypothetical protein